MKPLQVAARFAAFAWYADYRQALSRTVQAEARRFSRQNWRVFLPLADKGLGRLLLRIAKARPQPQRTPGAAGRSVKRRPTAAV
jgi:hypothetical protein